VLRGGWEVPQRKTLLKNNCDGTFTDVTATSGLAEYAASTQAAVWVDINNELVTVTFDPERDQPDGEVCAYMECGSAVWHFLTGPVPAVHRVTDMFGMDFFPDEGLINHSLHTAVIDRQRKLVANIEGNQYSAEQLGDLVETVLNDSEHRRSRLKRQALH